MYAGPKNGATWYNQLSWIISRMELTWINIDTVTPWRRQWSSASPASPVDFIASIQQVLTALEHLIPMPWRKDHGLSVKESEESKLLGSHFNQHRIPEHQMAEHHYRGKGSPLNLGIFRKVRCSFTKRLVVVIRDVIGDNCNGLNRSSIRTQSLLLATCSKWFKVGNGSSCNICISDIAW